MKLNDLLWRYSIPAVCEKELLLYIRFISTLSSSISTWIAAQTSQKYLSVFQGKLNCQEVNRYLLLSTRKIS